MRYIRLLFWVSLVRLLNSPKASLLVRCKCRQPPQETPQGICYGTTDQPQPYFQGTVLLLADVLVSSCLVSFNDYNGKLWNSLDHQSSNSIQAYFFFYKDALHAIYHMGPVDWNCLNWLSTDAINPERRASETTWFGNWGRGFSLRAFNIFAAL